MLLEPELGMLVEIAPDLDHPGQDLARGGQHLGRLDRFGGWHTILGCGTLHRRKLA